MGILNQVYISIVCMYIIADCFVCHMQTLWVRATVHCASGV